MAEKYDDVLLPFLTLMRRELHANSRKGDRPGWLRMDPNTALLEVYWHTAKLSAAVKNNDGPAIMEHAADVANMAMMVLDVCGGLALVDGVKAGGSREAVAEDRHAVLQLLYKAHHREPCGPTLEAISAAIQHLQAVDGDGVATDGGSSQ